jgi:hypothetical protein
MGDTNYVGSIVKILENPIQKLLMIKFSYKNFEFSYLKFVILNR